MKGTRDAGEKKPLNVLFLCTGNSPRPITAEVILNRSGQGKFKAFSVGSQPEGQIHPYALDLLRKLHYDVTGLPSKSSLEFSRPARRSSISFSRSATMPQRRSVPSGRVSQ